MLYHLARFYDEWPGEDYDGSSCRGALKGWHRHGVCEDRLWPYRDKAGDVVFIEPAEGWDQPTPRSARLASTTASTRARSWTCRRPSREVGAIYCSGNVHAGWFPKTFPQRDGIACIEPPARRREHRRARVRARRLQPLRLHRAELVGPALGHEGLCHPALRGLDCARHRRLGGRPGRADRARRVAALPRERSALGARVRRETGDRRARRLAGARRLARRRAVEPRQRLSSRHRDGQQRHAGQPQRVAPGAVGVRPRRRRGAH